MFHAPFWLKNPHLQTLWAAGLHQGVFVRKHWERVELPDGDFVDLCWDASVFEETERPLAMILHGLEGSVYSPYAAGQMKSLARIGFRPFTFHFRGCSGEPNRHDRNYHSGDTGDIAYVVQMLKERHPSVPIVAVGYSMGANALIKWLGDTGNENPLAAACAVSPPFVLSAAADRIDEGFSKFYQWILIDSLKAKLREKFENRPCPIDLSCVPKIRNFWEFDDWITAPLNGFKDVHEYYSI
ncbi:MAG: alpha/beta fold hydrolase, partial [Chlamydiia bacterium]|nr:alpha/beta fold hydrolase [Chlamydiia bacterium]